MEKVINIDNKNIKFKSTAATPLRYKAQFGRDFFNDLMKLEPENTELDTEVIYNIIWVLAKTADKTIPPLIEWLDEFDSIEVGEVITEVKDMILASIKSKKK